MPVDLTLPRSRQRLDHLCSSMRSKFAAHTFDSTDSDSCALENLECKINSHLFVHLLLRPRARIPSSHLFLVFQKTVKAWTITRIFYEAGEPGLCNQLVDLGRLVELN